MKPMQRDSSTCTVFEWARPALRVSFTAGIPSPRLVAAPRRHALAERGALGRVQGLARERQHRRALPLHVPAVKPGEARHVLRGEARLALDDREQALAQPAPLGVHGFVLALELLDRGGDADAALRRGARAQEREQILVFV